MMRFFIAIILVIVPLAGAFAGSYEDAVDMLNGTDNSVAIKMFLPFAEADHAGAQVKLASLYRFGIGVNEDIAKSAYWAIRAAENGHIMGMIMTSTNYIMGTGLERDFKKSAEWSRIGAELGNSTSQVAWGTDLLHGRGVKKDRALAATWFERAAETVRAMTFEGIALAYSAGLLSGSHVAEDYERTMYWSERARQAGGLTGKGKLEHWRSNFAWRCQQLKAQSQPLPMSCAKLTSVR